ncbi:hypothetical protein O1611_g2634 [Lasiodiplodia mahajangana]|uniref:Uncharacterized protein n=1 Tax=Lasiodiplodia mahajangana TaxID=1108764 RepID=A0ACC2JUR0_9PEZI|nr:hypothetical protein O1611_g2634 [Lasiodiplodia mahajangana]
MADRWNYERKDEEDDEEEEEELTEGHYKAQKDALIFAIQVSESMLAPPPKSEDKKATKDSATLTALKCAYQVMQQRIISHPRDMIGIILFGTKNTKTPDIGLQDSHCYLLTDLEVPAADDVKALRGLVEEGEDADEILAPSEKPADMVILLRLVLHLFQTRAPNFGSRRLFIITNDDDPCAGMKKNPSWDPAVGAKDIHDHGCTIELFPITQGESKFDTSKFYDDIIYRDPALDEENLGKVAPAKSGDGLNLLQSLISNVNSRQTPKRAYFSNMPFEIGPGLTISVKGYNIIQKQAPARSCYIWLEGEKPQVAIGETARLAEDSARTVQNFEVKKAYKFGSEYVYFTDEEQKSIKQFGTTCIRIIGFKDRALLKFWASVKKSIYIFPSEEGYIGSTRVFTALWQKLLKSKKVGIAWHIARRNGNPQLVAIIPSRSTSDERSGTQYMPAGLWLYPIPFVDDVRDGPEAGRVIRTTNALTDRMNTVVQQLQLPGGIYNPSKYPNPALQWHYKILQALALEDVVPDQPDDATVPKYRAIHKRCGGYIQEWSRVADDVFGQIQEGKKIKRELEGDNEEDEPRPAKKARGATAKDKIAGEDGLSNAELRKRYDAGTLAKLTVAELRSAMSSRGLDTKGLKKDLVDKLEQACGPIAIVRVAPSKNSKATFTNSSPPKRPSTRAEHISPSFEFLSHTPFHLPADPENGLVDGTGPDPAQAQQPPIARTVIASETVQNQPTDDPALQKVVAKHISYAIGAVDGSAWTVRQVTRGAQGWQFSYICKDSLQAWNRANAKNPDRPIIGSYSGPGGLDPINLSRPAFDCRGTLTIAFSKSSRGVVVKYEHTPLHTTVTQLVDRLVPAPIPVPSGGNGNQRTPKAKRPRPADGEASNRKQKTPKQKPAPVDGEDSSRTKRTPKAKRPPPAGEENGEGSRRKRRKTGKAPTADMGGLEDAQNTPQSQAPSNSIVDKPGLTGFLNVPPAEAQRRRQTAIELLTGRGIEPSTLSPEQFNIFANQAPNLQSASLDMLAKYGAERLRIVHPDEKEQAASSSNSTPATEQAIDTSSTAVPAPPSRAADTPTKKSRSKKRKSSGPLTEVSIGNGAVVPLEQGGELGTTESALKPTASRARKTRGRCETCKQRNVQCTKEHPSCSVCIDAGVDCVYLPPKPRRKSEKLVETVEQEDSNIGEQNEDVQHEGESAGQTSDQPEPHIIIPPHPPPDIENEEFIPDPNILSGPVEHQTNATQSVSNNSYYQHSQSGINFPQISSTQAAASTISVPSFTYPQAQNNENAAQPASGVEFPPTSVHTQQPHGPPASQPIAASSTHQQTHSAPSTTRKSLPSSQPKQTPIPPPTIPTHTPHWGSSPPMHHSTSTSPKTTHQQAAKRPRSRKSRAEPEQQHENLKHAASQPTQYQSPMTRSPYQSAAHVNPRPGGRSQTNTPVPTNPRPPPKTSSTTTHQPATTTPSYTTSTATASSSAPSYDAYPRYNNNNSGNEHYTDTGTDHNSSRITYESSSYQNNNTSTAPSSYSPIPSYDYGRASGTSNPLSQALNSSTAYSGTTSSSANQWSTSQTRGAQNNNSSGAYSLPANSASTSHGYGTRAADSRALNQNASYSQSQSQPQSYNSYSSQQQGLNQQSQQNWYGFTAANSNNQASYNTNRQSGHASHRTGAPAYSGHYNGHEEQAIYDLLRTNSTNH